MKILVKEIVGLKVRNVEVIKSDNIELGNRVLNCTFKRLKGASRSYVYNFSMIEDVEETYDNDIVTIDLSDSYELLVHKLEYEAFTGKCFNEYSVYQEAKKIIFSHPTQYKARVVYTLADDEVGYKTYSFKELGAGYPAYYSLNEIEELEEYIKEKAVKIFEKDFIEVG
jgi:hypothetical protein